MNLLDKKVGLIAALAFILLSCEDPSEIGISINPDDKIGVYYVELPVEASMVYIDSVNTGSGSEIFSGFYSDASLGLTEAIAYTQVSWSSSTIKAEAVYDSITLSFDPSYFYGVDTNRIQNYTVHRIKPDTSITLNNYYKTNYISFEDAPIGQGSFLYRTTEDSMKLGRQDLFTFTLDNTIGAELFAYFKNKPDVEEDTIEFYKNIFRGLAIKGSPENDAIVAFNINDSDSKLTLHYHTSEDTVQLSLSTYVGVQSNGSTFNIVPNFSHISTDRSTGALPTVESYQEFTSNGEIYGQYLTGLVPKLDFSAFNNFVDTAGSFVINKADIVLGGVETTSPGLKPPTNFRLNLTDDSNLVKGAINNVSNVPLAFTYDEINDDYLADAHFYFSQYMDGRSDFDQALIYSSSALIDNFNVSDSDIKLRIYYTKLKK